MHPSGGSEPGDGATAGCRTGHPIPSPEPLSPWQGVPDDPGINQRALEVLYREMEAKQGLCKYAVSLSLVEIYNEVIR